MQKLYSVINCEQLQTLLNDSNALLLDCRKLNDYRTAHLDNALFVHDGLIESLIANGDRAQPLAIYCYHGHTSEHLAEAFTNAGFTQVFSLAGGYEAFKSHALSV